MKDIEKIERALIVIDMVNGFVKEGAMSDPYIAHIIPEIKSLTESFINDGEGVFFVKDAHEKDCAEFKKFPEHCIKGTEEAKLVSELKPYESYATRVYEKNSTSVLFAPGFMEDIRKMKNLREIVGVGCCSDICVLNAFVPLINYFDEKNKSVKIVVPENAVETYHAPYHDRDLHNEMAFKLMRQAGLQIVKTYK